MNSHIEEDKFAKENEKIKAKIESVEREINEDLALIPEYQLLQVYSKINKIITEIISMKDIGLIFKLIPSISLLSTIKSLITGKRRGSILALSLISF